ncbi:MAG TPA: carboxypeptidase regulatory-like domain-containing protein [Terriglobales bacterium]|nr:carboxypeptidase regulatory-like domain-containing protein [Terriglobales bacterium]
MSAATGAEADLRAPARITVCSFLIACAFLFFLLPLHAQKITGTISGVVSDPTGAVVANATVTITNVATGLARTATSSEIGEFTAPDLPNGTYRIVVQAPNFMESVVEKVEVHVASTALVNVQLKLGSTSEQVTVEANAIQVQTDSAQLGEVVLGQQVKDLPLNGRNFVELTQMQPGVSSARTFDAVGKGLKGGVNFAVNGNSMANNLFIVDGASNNDVGSNRTILIYPSLDSIAEFKMLRNAYGPEYGQGSGSVVNIVTRSGSNEFHGGVFYFGRNDALNSYDWFSARQASLDRQASTFNPSTGSIFSNPNGDKPILRRNDFGYSLGGPIKKDKLFFFWSQEWNREIRGVHRTGCVPSAGERAGDFSGGITCGDILTSIPAQFQAAGSPWKIATPAQSAVDEMGNYPLPNLPCPVTPAGASAAVNGSAGCNNWLQNPSSALNYRQENIRGDYNLTRNHTVTFRYTQDTWVNPAPNAGYWGDDAYPQLESNWAQPSKSLIGKLTSTIGSSLVNSVQFSYSNNRIIITPGGTNSGLASTLNSDIPTLFPADLKTHPIGIPALNLGNTGGTSQMIAPWSNKQDNYNGRDDLVWMHGKHTLKFGAFLGFNLKNEDTGGATAERLSINAADGYASIKTGMPLANAMIPGNVFSNLSETSTDVYSQVRWRDYEFYAGDSFKVNRRLTVDLGVRYSIMLTPFQPNGLMTSFNPALYDPTKPATDACNGLWIVPGTNPCGATNQTFGTAFSSGTAGPNRYLRNQNYHLFAPRVGIAYDVFGDGNTAFRAGIGQFFQRDRTAIYTMTSNAPFALTATGYSRTLDGAPLSASQFKTAATSPAGGFDPSTNVPNSWQWNVTMEHSFAHETSLQLAYVGNRAIHQLTTSDINEVPPSLWGIAAFSNPNNTGGNYMPAGATSPNYFRPYNHDGFLTWWGHYGDANYHALQALFKGKVKNVLVNASYSFSHSIGNVPLDESNGTANYQTLTWAGNSRLDRGNTLINRPHIFIVNVVAPLPELKGSNALVRGVAGGWQLGTILTAESGPSTTLFTAGLSENLGNVVGCTEAAGGSSSPTCIQNGLNALYGTGNQGPPWAPGSNRRPFVTGQSCTAGRSGAQIYNPGAFTVVGHTIGSMGNESPGFCRGPNFVNDDFSVSKTWKVSERVSLQFRMDAFNFFNHPNFSPGPDGGLGNPIGAVNCGPAVGGLYQPCSPTNNLITLQQPGSNLQATGIVNNNDREFQYGLRVIF